MKRTFLLFIILNYIIVYIAKGQSFSAETLQNASIIAPTSLQIGPDGKLYVSQSNGEILVLTVIKDNNTYSVIDSEKISLVQNTKNHDDDGAINLEDNTRLVTGILVTGTADSVIIYCTSSDPRQGGGSSNSNEKDTNLDTNSGIISKLYKKNGAWNIIHLVRGLPRSEENHATNGLTIDYAKNILLVASGGHTNAGAPSNNFAYLTEYALSAAILEINLNIIDTLPVLTDSVSNEKYVYDLPTLDDPTRENVNSIYDTNNINYNGIDVNDPFGGNDGLNQAKLIENGPVSIYASGFRNSYDILLTESNLLYTWDNGANKGWGGHPANEGVGTATNEYVIGEPGSGTEGPNDSIVNNKDGLHLISNKGYYGGHPVPIRANPKNAGLYTRNGNLGTFRNSITTDSSTSLPLDWPPVPETLANPIEGDFQNPGISDSSIFTRGSSTNGITEYKATNFDSIMLGNLLAVSLDGSLLNVNLNEEGSVTNNSDVTILASGFGAGPLDVTSQSDKDNFPGTIWTANLYDNTITILTPSDFSNCTGIISDLIDDDDDGYSNADEIDNGKDPCNSADIPDDFDKSYEGDFLISNLNETDDDDDDISDSLDVFPWDSFNGTKTNIPFNYPFLNVNPGTGFFGLGFTGLMTNNHDDYLNLIKNENNSDVEIIAGGAAGLFTINNNDNGTALGDKNTQKNAYQLGIAASNNTPPFYIEASANGPFFEIEEDSAYTGLYVSNGDQSNFILASLRRLNSINYISIIYESNDSTTEQLFAINNLDTLNSITFRLNIFPFTDSLEVQYSIDFLNYHDLGNKLSLPSAIKNTMKNQGYIATGIMSSSIGISKSKSYNTTWSYLKTNFIENNANGDWFSISDHVCENSCLQGRHEHGYVQVGDKFYLIGGRKNESNGRVNVYDPILDTWKKRAIPPINIHHFQPIVYDNLIYIINAFTGSFPNEEPVSNIYIYDPISNSFILGPEIPINRRRGASGAALYKDKIYISGGIQNGHIDGWVPWHDVFDPKTNTWTELTDAPRSRDHFKSVVKNDSLYIIAGRNSEINANSSLGNLIDSIDIYSFESDSWKTIDKVLPTLRAGNATATIGNEIIILGGEDSLDAKNTVEAFNVNTHTWRTLAPMIQKRHGFEAIVNNYVVYVASGKTGLGGTPNTEAQEVFFFSDSSTAFIGYPVKQGEPKIKTDYIYFDTTNQIKNIVIENNESSQGVLVKNINNCNKSTFDINLTGGYPRLIHSNSSLSIPISPVSNKSEIDLFEIEYAVNTTEEAKSILVAKFDGENDSIMLTECINEAISLEGKLQNSKKEVKLSWNPELINSISYSILQSSNNVDFHTITNFDEEAGINEYTTTYDTNSLVQYFKIKLIFEDTLKAFSNSLRVLRNSSLENGTIIFPNPSSQQKVSLFSLDFEEKSPEVSLITYRGELIKEENNLNREGNYYIFDLPLLEIGIYYLRIKGDENTTVEKLIITR